MVCSVDDFGNRLDWILKYLKFTFCQCFICIPNLKLKYWTDFSSCVLLTLWYKKQGPSTLLPIRLWCLKSQIITLPNWIGRFLYNYIIIKKIFIKRFLQVPRLSCKPYDKSGTMKNENFTTQLTLRNTTTHVGCNS